MSNYLNEQELNSVKGLLHYLNQSMASAEVDVVVQLTDSNEDGDGD